jgi:hypothetical protein
MENFDYPLGDKINWYYGTIYGDDNPQRFGYGEFQSFVFDAGKSVDEIKNRKAEYG